MFWQGDLEKIQMVLQRLWWYKFLIEIPLVKTKENCSKLKIYPADDRRVIPLPSIVACPQLLKAVVYTTL